MKYGFDNIKNIDIRNISDTGREAYDASFDNAMLLSKNPEYSSKISTIINSNVPKRIIDYGKYYSERYNKLYLF